jgi:tetratricopeptide (TPR) repeat protein
MAQGHFLEAIPNLEDSLNRRKVREHKTSEDVFESAKELALANSALGHHHAAIEACKQALQIHPDDSNLLETEGLAYSHIRQTADAAPLLERALVEYKKQN